MDERGSKPRRFGIRFKFAVGIGALIVALMGVDALWNMGLQQRQAENEALEKAEVLADEMRAVWDFVDLNQDVVNRNDDGTFRTKHLVCVVAAKSVATLFTTNTNYIVRFTNTSPRQAANAPDEFEQRAFDAFAADPGLTAFYGVESDDEGRSVFRYVEPLYVTETCLECHGQPVGELDQYGYKKEGMQVGDVGGAMSITEPMDIYDSGMRTSVLQQVFMVLLVLVIAGAGIYVGVSRLVLRPIEALGRAAKRVGEGDFSYDLALDNVRRPDEVTEFARDFDKMARRLEGLCTDLESEVQAQTDKLSALNDLLLHQKAELKHALDRLSEETAYKNEFFAIMSHELRTPLTSILAFARMLRENDGLDAKTRSAVDEIEANATLLLNMVSNILTISKAEARKNELVREPVDFVDLLGFIRSSLAPVARNKDITLTAKAEPDVPLSMADWEKLRRIVENLVDNAIKYTHAGGSVSVRASFEPAPADAERFPCGAVALAVADDGMGIAPEDQEGIFERYRQAGQSPNRRYRGTGLGLAVVKELAELHGGTVELESERKVGSTFTVRIPYVAVDTEDYDEDSAR
ncbi:c-type heme family protein [Rubneribacter sp.]